MFREDDLVGALLAGSAAFCALRARTPGTSDLIETVHLGSLGENVTARRMKKYAETMILLCPTWPASFAQPSMTGTEAYLLEAGGGD